LANGNNGNSPAPGSPFVVGRPLRPDEKIFGREEAFQFIAEQLADFSSVNIVGERRLGKTSLLNHLLAHPQQYLKVPPDAVLVVARVDLQGGVTDAARFYGTTLLELLSHLPAESAAAIRFAPLRERLEQTPEADYDEFAGVLRQLHAAKAPQLRPVLMLDEFERLLDRKDEHAFPYPGFFDGIRSIMGTAESLALVVASRRPLAEYFADPQRPGSLTSSFPTYFVPFQLEPLDEAAAHALLLQPSDHTLTIAEATQAQAWAKGHPCHLQAAGAAFYEAKVRSRRASWVRSRFEELKGQNCMVSPIVTARPLVGEREKSVARSIFWTGPMRVGKVVWKAGDKLGEVAAWITGFVFVLLVVLCLLGVVSRGAVVTMLLKSVGLSPEGVVPTATATATPLPSPTVEPTAAPEPTPTRHSLKGAQ